MNIKLEKKKYFQNYNYVAIICKQKKHTWRFGKLTKNVIFHSGPSE